MILVLSELPVRFDNKLKMNLRTQLRDDFCVLPLKAKALLADSRNDPDKRDASTSDTESRQRRLVSFRLLAETRRPIGYRRGQDCSVSFLHHYFAELFRFLQGGILD